MGTTRTCTSCGDTFAGTLDHCPKDGAALYSEEVLSRIGMRLKDHEIQSVMGEGGMGVVYRAQHVVIEKPVAIKVLHDSFARRTDMVEQFIVEAKAASRIRHPNIIDVTDFGATDDGVVFLVMEYLEGESLETRLARVGRLPAFEAINIVKQVARGLGAAHDLGVVHRDMKPANIFLCRREGRRRIVRRTDDVAGAHFSVEPESAYDFVKLLDFGVAKFLDLGPSAATRAGVLCGSPHYLSPEQAQEQPATQRSDIYSLGATFYEMVTGTVPFDGRSMLEILTGHVAGVVEPASRRAPDAGIDASLDAVILKCLEKEPARRFASTDELCEALRDCITDRAFLRDAHRLPGIRDSGIDLSQAEVGARRRLDAPATAQAAEAGFSALEDGRAREPLADGDDDLDAGERTLYPSDTARIRRQRGHRTLGLALGAVLFVAGLGALLWLTRDGAKPAAPRPAPASLVAAAPPPPPPAPVAAASSPAVTAGAGDEPAKVGQTPPPSSPAPTPAIGLGKAPERAPDKPVATRSYLGPGPGRGHLASPPPPESAPPPPPAVGIAPAPAAVPVPAPPAPAPAPPPAPVATGAEVEALLRDAQQAWTRQYYALAIEKARAVLEADPRRQAAHQIIAVCSCAMGSAEEAREAVSHLDDHKRKLVQTLCQRHGVTLEP
jgi:serine/threonine protein kinase